MNIYEQIAGNRRGTFFLIAVFISFFLLIGLGVDYFYGEGIRMPAFSMTAILLGMLLSYAGYAHGDRLILSSTHAEGLDLGDPKQRLWQNVVEEMSIASGIPVPRTYIIHDPDPNAFATGIEPKRASIAVTEGLLTALNREELQAVASHEMSHIKNYDIRLMLLVSVLVGSIALISDWAARGLYRGRRGTSGSRREGPAALVIFAIWLIAVILAPIMSRIIAMFVSRKREYLADASGAELTRNPLALASALEKIQEKVAPTRSINKGTAHLSIADPGGSPINFREGRIADLFATHPPMHKRIEALRQMAYVK